MFNVGSGEFLVIFLLALIVLGPDKLPDAAKKVGKVMGDLRKLSSGFQQEMRQAMDVEGLKNLTGPTLPPASGESSPAGGSPTAGPTEIVASSPTEPTGGGTATPPSPSPGLKSVPNDAGGVSPPAKGQQGAA